MEIFAYLVAFLKLNLFIFNLSGAQCNNYMFHILGDVNLLAAISLNYYVLAFLIFCPISSIYQNMLH